MLYMLLIYDNEPYWSKVTPAQGEATMQRHDEIAADLRKNNQHYGCAALALPSSATCVRRENGSTTVTDGPYAETKEFLGGYYLIEAKNLDEAIAYAKRLPLSDPGAAEIRPIKDFSAEAAGRRDLSNSQERAR